MGVSAFDLLGELDLETGRFQNSVKGADEKLAGLQSQIDKTEKAAVRFGGVSATTSRSFEKLSEKITAQRDRMAASTLAFEQGTIGAKSYAAALASVEKQASAVSSRLKDARARISDMTAASTNASGGTHGLGIGPSGQIRGFGPVFRAAGLQQFGLDESIVSALNVARTAAGISAGAIASIGGAAAVGAAIVAVTEKMKTDSEALLNVQNEMSGAYNRQIAGIQEMTANYEKFKQLVASGIKFDSNVEKLISSGSTSGLQDALNKIDASKKETINKISALQKEQLQNESLLKTTENLKTHEAGNKNLLRDVVSAFPLGDLVSGSVPDTPGASDAYTASQKQLDIAFRNSQITKNKADLESLNQELSLGQDQFRKLSEAIKTVGDNSDKAFSKRGEDWLKAQAEAAKVAREQIDKTIKKLGELEKTSVTAIQDLRGKLVSDNPVAAAMLKASEAVEKLKTDLKGLPAAFVAIQVAAQQKLNLGEVFGAQIDASLNAINLRSEATKFRGPTDAELAARGLSKDQISGFRNQQGRDQVDSALRAVAGARTEQDQARADRALTNFANSFSPDSLRKDQREAIAAAFDRQADRQDKFFTDAPGLLKEISANTAFVKNFYDKQKSDAKSGTKVDIFLKDDTSDKKATNATVATENDVAKTYDIGFFRGSNQ